MSTSTKVATRPPTPKERMQVRLEKLTPALAQIAAKHIDPDRMTKMALMACERVPQLMDCTPKSLFMGLLQASEMGLEVGSGFGHAYLLPFRERRSGKKEAVLVVGYQGYIELIHRTGTTVRAVNVFEGDTFEYEEGTTPRIRHLPDLSVERSPSTLKFSYAVGQKLAGGPPVMVVLTKAEVDAIRARSPSKNSSDSPWVTDYLAMALKSPVRRLAKMLPKSREIAQALDIDENPDSESVSEWQQVLDGALSDDDNRPLTDAGDVSGSEVEGVTYDG